MPPAAAPAAPAMPSAPGGGGIEARPAVPASTPPPPEVSTDPARVAARQQEAARLASLPPDAVLADLDRAHEAARAAGAAEAATPGGTQAATAPETGSQPIAGERTDLQGTSQGGPETQAAQSTGAIPEVQQTPGQRAFAEIVDGLQVQIGADTTVDGLMQTLAQKGWQSDEQTRNYVQDAITYAQVHQATESGQPVAAEQQTVSGNGTVAAAESEQSVIAQEGATQAVAPGEGTTSSGQAAEATAASPQAAQEAAANQPSEDTIQQALRAMGKADTPANREEAKRLIAAKAEADVKAVVEKFGKKKEKELLPEEQKLMEGMSKLVAENTDEAQKWLDILAKEDPEYFKWLKEKLDIYKQQEDAKKSKFYMAAGIMGFLMYLVYNTLTTSEGR